MRTQTNAVKVQQYRYQFIVYTNCTKFLNFFVFDFRFGYNYIRTLVNPIEKYVRLIGSRMLWF